MQTIENLRRPRVAATYNSAADHFDAPALGFWERHGRRAIHHADLQSGQSVLDVGCGTGASALPAAAAVGPTGSVIGIDIAAAMLDRARKKAAEQGLTHIRFEQMDMISMGFRPDIFDAVISVFSVFFVEDIAAQVAELWRVVRPGGRLVLTFWGKAAFQPGATIFAEELGNVRPDIPKPVRAWERFTTRSAVTDLVSSATGVVPIVHIEPDRQPLATHRDWWIIAMGSGYRWEIDQLTVDERCTLKDRITTRLQVEGVGAVMVPAIHAVVTKPS